MLSGCVNIHWKAPRLIEEYRAHCTAAKLFDSQYLNSDDTLRRIYEVANEDVEMKVCDVPSCWSYCSRSYRWQDAPSGDMLYIVVDTNVLIDHLNVVTRFIEDIEALTLPVVIVVPNVVISELDGCVRGLCSYQTNYRGSSFRGRQIEAKGRTEVVCTDRHNLDFRSDEGKEVRQSASTRGDM